MINPFRNLRTDVHPFMSASVYSASTPTRRTSSLNKGFFHRLFHLGRVLHLPAETSYQTVEIEAEIDAELPKRQGISVEIEAEIDAELPKRQGISVNDNDKVADGISQAIAAKIDNSFAIDRDIQQKNAKNSSGQKTPDSTACLQEAHFWLQQGDLAVAIANYQQAIQLDPSLIEAYECLAEALTQQGDLEAAAGCYRQAIALSQSVMPHLPQSVPQSSPHPAAKSDRAEARKPLKKGQRKAESETRTSWFEQASFHLQQASVICNAGDWQEAQTACQRAIDHIEPEAATAYLILGRSLQGQKQLAAAEQAYHKSLTLVASAEVYARLGSLYAEQQRFADAAQFYETAIQHDANFAGAYWKLAEVWQQLNQEAQAVGCWYRAFQLQPQWANATDYCQLGDRLLHLKQLEAAHDCYEKALHLNTQLAEAQIGIGAVLTQQGQPTQAIARYRLAIEHSQNSQIYAAVGEAFTKLEQWEDARICYQQLVELTPDCLDALKGLYSCLTQLNCWQEALVYSRKLVEHQPDSAQDWQNLGDVLSRLSQWSEAVMAYEQVIRLDPSFSWAYNNLGDVFLQLEQWQSAVTAFRTAISLNPDFAWSHYNLGKALAHLQDWDHAIAAYRTALKQQPDLPYALSDLADALQQRSASDQANALAFYRRAIQQNPHEPEHYHKAIELEPDAIDLYLGLVDALLARNQGDDALVCCQLARQLQPESEEVIAKLREVLQQRELTKRPQTAADAAIDYQRWMEQNTPTAEQLQQMAESALSLPYQPLISILMPVYNPPESFLRAAIESVLNQVYLRWQLCIADDASDANTRAILNEYVSRDPRIKVIFRPENGQISAASNSALDQATGAFVVLLDHDDVLAPEALYEVASLLNRHPEADMIYSDEDKLDQQGQRIHPFFKPDWCPDSFLSRMYTCHLGVYRRQLVNQIGGFRVGYEGSQDYDLVLRLTEHTDQIFHIPKVLYHWRSHANSMAGLFSAKPYADVAAQRALTEACQRRGEPVQRIETNPDFSGVYVLRYQIAAPKPVSIIIPTRNLGDTLDRCLTSLFTKSTYPNYEVLLIDNGSDEIDALNTIARWEQQEPERLRCYSLDIPFNYSRINNLAITEANGDYLLFLNNDVEIIAPDWIEAMVEQAQRSSIGAVGGRLLYPDHTIQHAGVVLGIGGVAGHSHKYFPGDHPGYVSQLISINNYSAVTAACMMCRRVVFEQVGGFDETLAVAFNDVDLCLKMQQAGYRNVYLPHVQLYHYESKSRGVEDSLEKQNRFKQELDIIKQRWGELLEVDPCYNSNLSLGRENYSIRL